MHLYNTFGTIRVELHNEDNTASLLIKNCPGDKWQRLTNIAFSKGDNKPALHLCSSRGVSFKPGSLPRDRNKGSSRIYPIREMADNQPMLGVKIVESNGYTYAILVVFLGNWVEICTPGQVFVTCKLVDVKNHTQ